MVDWHPSLNMLALLPKSSIKSLTMDLFCSIFTQLLTANSHPPCLKLDFALLWTKSILKSLGMVEEKMKIIATERHIVTLVYTHFRLIK